MSLVKLVYTANQIGKFFAHQPDKKVIANIADHSQKYWDPRMRKAIIAHKVAGGVGLDPRVIKAIENLKEMVSSN